MTPGKEADAVLWHRVLIRWLIPQVDTPPDMIRMVRGGHVKQAVVE